MRPRTQILEWAEQGAIPPASVDAALAATGATPARGDWHRFSAALLLWLGALLLAAGVIFFFAYNWGGMGRFAKFGLVEGLLGAAVFVAIRRHDGRRTGRAHR